METLLQKLVKSVVCTSCGLVMKPPLNRCSVGDYYCEKCTEIYTNCSAECRSAEGAGRDHLLEKLCFGIEVKCTFASAGCNFKEKAFLVAKHEKICDFSKVYSLTLENNNLEVEGCDRDGNPNCETLKNKSKSHSVTAKMNSSMSRGYPKQSLEEAILADLECPVCYMRISPPISQCFNGHRVCRICFDQLEKCPVCRGPKSVSTHCVLEMIYCMMEMPCRNDTNGCGFYGKGTSVVEHEKTCGLVQGSCPLMWNRMCDWQGPVSEVEDHCRSTHSQVLSVRMYNKFSVELPVDNRPLMRFFYAHGLLFRCSWQKHGKYFRFSVNYLGDKKCNRVLLYGIRIDKNRFTYSCKPIVRRVCFHLNDADDSIEKQPLTVNSEFIQQHLDCSNRLNFLVTVFFNVGDDLSNLLEESLDKRRFSEF